jgi:Prophage endopeptidase tail
MLARIYDPLENKGHNMTGFDSMTRTRRINGEKTLTFDLHKTPANAHWFDEVSHMWKVNWMGEKFVAPLVQDDTEGNTYVRQIDAVYSLYDDLRNDFQYESFSGSKTFDDMMHFILNGTGYTYSTVDFFYAQEFENFGYDFRSELFFTALDRYGAEFTESGMHITFRSKVGNETDFQYRHKFNIESVTRQIDAMDFSTYGKYFGKDGLEAEYRSPLADLYPLSNGGDRHLPSKTDERFTKYDSLYAAVKKAVDDSLKISITFKFEDMRAAGYPRPIPQEGDSVLMVDERLGLKIRARIVEIIEVFDAYGNIIDCDVTLSNFTNLQSQNKRRNKAISDIEGVMNGEKTIPFVALDRELQRLAGQIFETESQVEYNENGIVARSKNNLNHLLILNNAGLLISTDNGQTARLAITARGIATELLTAGAIYTNNIKIVGKDDYFYWDGTGLYAINPDDTAQRVVLRSNGLFIRKGAITIERDDGYAIVNNGKLNLEFSVQFAPTGWRSSEVQQAGIYVQTEDTTKRFIQYGRFRHDSRYLRIIVGQRVVQSGETCILTVERTGNKGVYVTSTETTTSTDWENTEKRLSVDLGIPTGDEIAFYVMLRSKNGTPVQAYVLGAYLEG